MCFITCTELQVTRQITNWDLAHRYAIFLCSLDVEIITNSWWSVQLTNWSPKFPLSYLQAIGQNLNLDAYKARWALCEVCTLVGCCIIYFLDDIFIDIFTRNTLMPIACIFVFCACLCTFWCLCHPLVDVFVRDLPALITYTCLYICNYLYVFCMPLMSSPCWCLC